MNQKLLLSIVCLLVIATIVVITVLQDENTTTIKEVRVEVISGSVEVQPQNASQTLTLNAGDIISLDVNQYSTKQAVDDEKVSLDEIIQVKD